jgi:hypothetical protein
VHGHKYTNRLVQNDEKRQLTKLAPKTPKRQNAQKQGGDMKKFFKRVADWLIFLFTGNGEIGKEAADEGLVDYSGQGRDKYGK